MNESALRQHRNMLNKFFKSRHSPLSAAQRRAFTGLNFFDPNPAYFYEIDAEEFPDKEEVMIPVTGDNPPQMYRRWGRLTFPHPDGQFSLLVFQDLLHEHFFLPFIDATCGVDTYGGGRYADPEHLGGTLFRVDFNKAYAPYCAYGDGWSCVLPPAENRITVRIEAGEKAFLASA